MHLLLCLSASLHNSSRGPLFWEAPLPANFTCLVITFCHWDIKHSGVLSWEQPRREPWNKLNIRRREAACQRWDWQERCREGCFLPRAAACGWVTGGRRDAVTRLEHDGSSCFSLEKEHRPSDLQNTACGCVLCAGKMFHQWINVTVNFPLWERIRVGAA